MLLGELRLTRDALRYGFAVGKVRVLETRALDRSALERLLDARDFAEQKRLISETPYAPYLEDATTAEEVEQALDGALDGFYRFLDDAALPHSVVGFFRIKYDFVNLKAALKARALGAPLDGLLVEHGTVNTPAFAGALGLLSPPYGALAKQLAEETQTSVLDAAVDRAYFAELGRLAHSAGSPYLEGLAALSVDVANVKTLVRGALAGMDPAAVAELLIDGGSAPLAKLAILATEELPAMAEALVRMPALKGLVAADIVDPARLDPATDALVTAALRRGRHEAAGPEPVIAYVMGREAEVRTLRVLLLGRLTGIDNETLRARVSATYQ